MKDYKLRDLRASHTFFPPFFLIFLLFSFSLSAQRKRFIYAAWHSNIEVHPMLLDTRLMMRRSFHPLSLQSLWLSEYSAEVRKDTLNWQLETQMGGLRCFALLVLCCLANASSSVIELTASGWLHAWSCLCIVSCTPTFVTMFAP
jgi:hypothetical protein